MCVYSRQHQAELSECTLDACSRCGTTGQWSLPRNKTQAMKKAAHNRAKGQQQTRSFSTTRVFSNTRSISTTRCFSATPPFSTSKALFTTPPLITTNAPSISRPFIPGPDPSSSSSVPRPPSIAPFRPHHNTKASPVWFPKSFPAFSARLVRFWRR